jgi:hypothetical protein
MFFSAPEGWICPTGANHELGVDIRGVGGFAMLPPSKHESGKNYEWMEGWEPWNVEISTAPKWLCDEIEELLSAPGGKSLTPRVKTQAPEVETDQWGKRVNGREDLMKNMVFRRVIDLYREAPIIPTENEQTPIKKELFESYVEAVESRIKDPYTPKHILLEREGRGITLFNQKWRSAIRQWDDKIANEAAKPPHY